MKLNEEQYNTAIKMKELVAHVREQFPEGCDCFTDCTGCPLEDFHGNQLERKVCSAIGIIGMF